MPSVHLQSLTLIGRQGLQRVARHRASPLNIVTDSAARVCGQGRGRQQDGRDLCVADVSDSR